MSHEKAEAEETVCITEKNKKPGDKVVPWCPGKDPLNALFEREKNFDFEKKTVF